ncbi:MAG: (2Fe-2S) ferredoxin domain-containing protein [Firmicutes bacterium]|nr:(2Fe-2S) ferredoxin domain-containing protein [Bacillota bacterium]
MTYKDFYKELRQSAEETIEKKKRGKLRIVLGYAICSVSVGANEVLRALEETVVEAELKDVIIETTGCIGLCSKEPLVDVITKEGKKYTYELVDKKKARAILISHAMYNEPVDEWLIKM